MRKLESVYGFNQVMVRGTICHGVGHMRSLSGEAIGVLKEFVVD